MAMKILALSYYLYHDSQFRMLYNLTEIPSTSNNTELNDIIESSFQILLRPVTTHDQAVELSIVLQFVCRILINSNHTSPEHNIGASKQVIEKKRKATPVSWYLLVS